MSFKTTVVPYPVTCTVPGIAAYRVRDAQDYSVISMFVTFEGVRYCGATLHDVHNSMCIWVAEKRRDAMAQIAKMSTTADEANLRLDMVDTWFCLWLKKLDAFEAWADSVEDAQGRWHQPTQMAA